jgi:hypothetical protein
MSKLAPIVIFAFNRPRALQAMVDSLRMNPLFEESERFVFIDGPRTVKDEDKIAAVKDIAYSITNHVIVSDKNKGLANSIISGVTDVVNQYGKVIVLEDDLHLMPGFLKFMNEALDRYEKDERIFSVCGYGLRIKRPKGYEGDVYLSLRSSSWGWATWKNRWLSVDWEVKDWEELSTHARMQRAFNRGGSDMFGMLRGYMTGQNNSWAIRFCYSQFKQRKSSVHPFLSFVDNEGFGEEATNCNQKYSRFKVDLNGEVSPTLHLPQNLQINKEIIRANYRYHSLIIRIYSKIRKIFNV